MKESQQAGANYIITFFNDIQLLNHTYSQYINLIMELENKYSDEDVYKTMEENEKQNLNQLVQTLRHYCHKVFIQFKSIYAAVESPDELLNKKNDELKTIYYEKVRKNYIIKSADIEEFIVNINSVLVTDLIKNLLRTSQDIITEIYNANNNANTS